MFSWGECKGKSNSCGFAIYLGKTWSRIFALGFAGGVCFVLFLLDEQLLIKTSEFFSLSLQLMMNVTQ